MRKRISIWTFAVLASAALVISCASQKNETAADHGPVWPPPPDEARVVFVKTISKPLDIGQSPSVFRRVANWITGDDGASLRLQKPFGIALDENGNLCLTDTGANCVCYLDFKNKKWLRWDAVGKTHFKSPVAVARKSGIFYVADSELGKVFAFRGNGKPVFEIGAPLKRPVGLAIANDSLAVVDSQLHCVFVFDLQGKLRFQFGKRGIGPGEFNFPTHVNTDNAGHLLVTDSLNSRVQIFSADGKYISEIGSGGDTSGHFGRPKGMAADSFNHIYVADAVFDNVQIFDLSGRLLLNLGETGNGYGQFGLPNGIAISPDNVIYIADCYNHRVQVLKYIGAQ
ncbi:MAG TPA: 6-bladed beta-propeller [Verrucomicrobiae bacterium]|nr:6-bladed beta-propeller [Verrucomicrobiae bacterium]